MTISATNSAIDTIEERARDVVAAYPPAEVPIAALMGAWYDAGLSWVHFPIGLGGLEAPRTLQAAANRILQAAGGP